MAKKLIFRKSGALNLSIDEENLTANTWTLATATDFGVFTPVGFMGKLYYNQTGVFTDDTPAIDSIKPNPNWVEISVGGINPGAESLDDLTDVTIANPMDGDVIISDSSGNFTNQQPPTDQITVSGNDTEVGTQPEINFKGNINVIEDTANNRIDVYDQLIQGTTGTGVSQVVEAGLSGNFPSIRIRNLINVPDETTVTQGATLTDPIAVGLSSTVTTAISANTTGVDSLVAPNGKLTNIGNVTIANPMAGDVIVSDSSGNFTNQPQTSGNPQLEVKGTAREILVDSTIANEVTLSTQLGPVSTTPPTNRQVLEYSASGGQYEPVDVPSGVALTFEELEDVNIPALVNGKVPVSVASSASVDIETADSSVERFGVNTSAGLMFSVPEGTTPITEVAFDFGRNQSADTTAYSGSNGELSVFINFMAATTTIDEIYTRCSSALDDTAWPGGERTIDGVLFHRNGDFSTPVNPRFIAGGAARGSITFRKSSFGPTDTGMFSWSIDSRPNGHIFLQTFALTNQDSGDDQADLDAFVAQIASGLNASGAFSAYTATASNGTLIITSKTNNAGDNGNFDFRVGDTANTGNTSGNILPNASATRLTGGVDPQETPTTFRWTDTDHMHSIAKPTALGDAILYFTQGGFVWNDRDYQLDSLEDVTVVSSTQKQMLTKPAGTNSWTYDNARIESLNVASVSNHPGSAQQGAILQYHNFADGSFEFAGLRDTGSNVFSGVPFNNQFMVYFNDGTANPVWRAKTPIINDMSDVNIVNPTLSQTLVYDGSNWTNHSANSGVAFYEVEPFGNVGSGIYGLQVARFDSSTYTNGSNKQIGVRAAGAYEIEFAYDFEFSYNDGGTATDFFNLEVRKNDSANPVGGTASDVIPVNDYAHGINVDDALGFSNALTITSGSVQRRSGKAGPLIVNLEANDFITMTFFFSDTQGGNVDTNITGLGITNHNSRKPWIKITRVG